MIIEFDELKKIRQLHSQKTIVFCAGVWDLLHVGHVEFFESCKRLGDILVVMLGNDNVIKILKGETRPIIPLNARIRMVDSLKSVDYTFIDYISTVEDAEKFMDGVFANLHPDIYTIGEDTSVFGKRKNTANKYGVKLVILPRTIAREFEPVSTSKIINKIKNSY